MDPDSFHVINLGCKVNKVEADALAAALLSKGCASVAEEEAALIVVNTCTVTGEADKKARKAARHALSCNPHARVVVTGCAAAINAPTFSQMDERIEVIPREQLLVELAEGAPRVLRMGDGFRTRVNVKIQDGCDHACTYCIVHVARGKGRSAAFHDVVAECDEYFKRGAKEIVLAGIDLASYESAGKRLADLSRALLESADAACTWHGGHAARIRVSSVEPQTLGDEFPLLMAQSGGRICRHLHVPLQSGSTKVLAEMNRPYTAQWFLEQVNRLYELMPSLSLTTDIICGFPGETDEDFEETLDMARKCRFSKIHVFPYSPRAGTPAASRTDQVAPEVKARRASQLRELASQLRQADFESRRGSAELALVEADVALLESYHEIEVPKGSAEGELVEVVI